MTPADFERDLNLAVEAADIALPLAGHAEIVPIVHAAKALIEKIATYVQTRNGDAAVAAAMEAARTATDVAEALKFPKG